MGRDYRLRVISPATDPADDCGVARWPRCRCPPSRHAGRRPTGCRSDPWRRDPGGGAVVAPATGPPAMTGLPRVAGAHGPTGDDPGVDRRHDYHDRQPVDRGAGDEFANHSVGGRDRVGHLHGDHPSPAPTSRSVHHFPFTSPDGAGRRRDDHRRVDRRRTVGVSWDAGQPLPLSGTGTLELTNVALTGSGRASTPHLDGAPTPSPRAPITDGRRRRHGGLTQPTGAR